MRRRHIGFLIGIVAGIAVLASAVDAAEPQVRTLTAFGLLRTHRHPAQMFRADATEDGIPEDYHLRHGSLTIRQTGSILWTSPSSWWVDGVAVADADNDGTQNVVLSVWRSGDFGPSKPFWVRENNPAVRQHLFVFRIADGTLQPVWQSSNLTRPNCRIAFDDTDNDGRVELIADEGQYTAMYRCIPERTTRWQWREWGFERIE